ncbi:MAG TPA: heme-binding domain-containing protein [Polyangia bacterium]|nr:heme-binding domain-containing protein [Polyangia bacterium]
MTPKTKKWLRNLIIAGVVGFGVLQIFPAKVIGVHTEEIGKNPPKRYTLDAPPEVHAILRRACFDCHTNETEWPFWSRIAPGSWLMARDVHNGRNHVNFSEWADHDDDERQTDFETAWEQVESGKMPKWFYVYPLHLGARLSDADKALLKGFFMKGSSTKKAEATADAKTDTKTEAKPEAKE